MRPSRVWVRRVLFTLTAAAWLALAGSTAYATEPTKEDHERRIKELEETVERLNKDTRKVEVTLESQKPIAGWQNGFFLASPDGANKLKITGYTQADGRFFIDDDDGGDTNRFLFRRVRPSLEGTLLKYFDFRVMPDFAGSSLQLFDAYVDIAYFPNFKLRVGKFKPPVGLERLQSATAIAFVERGLPTNLVPSRDLGVQLWGEPFNGALTYAVGIFNGAQDLANNDGDANDDKDVAARLFAHPLRNTTLTALQNLGVGVAGTFGHQRGRPTSASNSDLPSYRSTGQATIFSYQATTANLPAGTPPDGAYAAGDRWRFSPQGYYYFGPFGLLGEYVVSSNEVQRLTAEETLNHTAWQIAASYVITGEPASYKGVVPARPFNPLGGTWGWGAFEVAARYGQLNIDGDAFDHGFADPKRSVENAQEWQIGLNWHLNRNLKVVLDYAKTHFDRGTATGDRETEHVIFTRLQLVL